MSFRSHYRYSFSWNSGNFALWIFPQLSNRIDKTQTLFHRTFFTHWKKFRLCNLSCTLAKKILPAGMYFLLQCHINRVRPKFTDELILYWSASSAPMGGPVLQCLKERSVRRSDCLADFASTVGRTPERRQIIFKLFQARASWPDAADSGRPCSDISSAFEAQLIVASLVFCKSISRESSRISSFESKTISSAMIAS